MSLLADGLGQLYNGEPAKGLCFFFLGLGWLASDLLIGPWLGLYSPAAALCLAFIPKLAFAGEAASTARRIRIIRPRAYNRPAVYLLFILAALTLQEALILPAADRVLENSPARRLRFYSIRAAHMAPTLEAGSRIRVDPGYYDHRKVQRGDIVAFPLPGQPAGLFVGRVIGLSGERIRIVDKKVFLDGRELKESYAVFNDPEIRPRGASPRDNFGPAPIPRESCFVLGDNRDLSWDSRFFGAVLEDRILGKVIPSSGEED